ncbi:DUF5906 domain-containing protein [Staphylococcus epidermidis]|nr:DUF5906 domain-containing protein [Staphylococcus epidermidis]MCG1157024.1 DUF5906 domain-containing protein [Staphylococcus epidermidis]
MAIIQPNKEIIQDINSSQNVESVEERLTRIGNEERQKLLSLWEENGKNGKKPSMIGTNRCAYILMEEISFVLFDEEENTKLAMYQENRGIYTQKVSIIKRIISYLEPKFNSTKADDVIYHIKNRAIIKDKTNSPNLIPVNNGIYNKKTKQLEPFTPEYVFTAKIDTNYIDNAQMPTIDGWSFDSWLDEIACGDIEVFNLLWQVINDSLNGNYTRKKAIFLVGDGNNGKGTFQMLLTNLIGFDNVASLKVNEFDHEFKPSVLEGKTLVIGDDVPVGVNIEDSSNFNSVVTGDPILINIKKQQPYKAIFRCTVIQSTNGMPRFKNKTGGTNRRLLIVPFNADFNSTVENADIKDKYIKNKQVLEYVLYKAINLEFQKFTIPKISSEMLEDYKQDNDPVYDFKRTEFDNWKIDKVPKVIVYERYKVFCANNGYLALSERKFQKSFKQYLSKDWNEGKPRYYSYNDLVSKVGYFDSSLLPQGEQKKSYVNQKLKVV